MSHTDDMLWFDPEPYPYVDPPDVSEAMKQLGIGFVVTAEQAKRYFEQIGANFNKMGLALPGGTKINIVSSPGQNDHELAQRIWESRRNRNTGPVNGKVSFERHGQH